MLEYTRFKAFCLPSVIEAAGKKSDRSSRSARETVFPRKPIRRAPKVHPLKPGASLPAGGAEKLN
jgi:hypothetical protein